MFTRSLGTLRGSNAEVVALDKPSGAVTTLIAGGSHARYASSGHIVYSFSERFERYHLT
jgi:hypothetical protein